MSTVAFLASVVDPRIALAASKSAMQEFNKIKDEVPTSLLNAHLKHVEQTHAEGKLDLKASLALTSIAGTELKEEPQQTKEDENAKKDETSNVEKMDVDKKDNKITENGDKKEEKDDKAADKKEDKDKTLKTDEESNNKEEKKDETSKLDPEVEKLLKEGQISAAASTALASASIKAKHLAGIEEKKIKQLVALLVETQMRKLGK